ncbi:MAG TPA: hypothetical protein VF463_10045 [Sphingobium sp.]
MAEIWSRLAQQVGRESRTDVLRALVWPNAMLLTALVTASMKQAPTFLLVILSGLLIIFMILYAASYITFGIKDPNLLRSERYNIEKLAIERGILGDSTKGIVDSGGGHKMIGGAVTIEKSE